MDFEHAVARSASRTQVRYPPGTTATQWAPGSVQSVSDVQGGARAESTRPLLHEVEAPLPPLLETLPPHAARQVIANATTPRRAYPIPFRAIRPLWKAVPKSRLGYHEDNVRAVAYRYAPFSNFSIRSIAPRTPNSVE